jgi:tetraprenyl-beta-curcumene synthase
VEGIHRTQPSRSAWVAASDTAALLRLGLSYWLRIQPQVQRELAVWESRAREIPDPLLRRQALNKLEGERLNPEAAALFAVLAPPAQRKRVVKLIVAYQVLYDYLDGVNEQPGYDGLTEGLQLHLALSDAVLPQRLQSDYYQCNPTADDGGYMRALCGFCRDLVTSLPSIHRCAGALEIATERCAEAQSHNHATRDGHEQLTAWSLAQPAVRRGYHWWELAAGGISCLNIHAILACAADPRASTECAAQVDEAYFPSICSLSALLDSLADYHNDIETGNHSFLAHYRDERQAAVRLQAITAEATRLIGGLEQHRRHRIILSGIVAYYLSFDSAWEGFPAAAAQRLTDSSGTLGKTMCAVMRARRRRHDRAVEARPRPATISQVLAEPGSAGPGKR